MIGTPHVERYNLTQRHIVGRTRRLCLAFSKTLRGHRAAIALGVFAYNFVRVHGALNGITPAMAAGLTDHPWTIAEVVHAALDVEPTEAPKPVPLVMPSERDGHALGASRELPGGRGFLRAVTDAAPAAKGAPALPVPSPETPPAAPALAVVEPNVDANGQLDLLSYRPRPVRTAPEPSKRLPPGQLSLFGIKFDPEPKK